MSDFNRRGKLPFQVVSSSVNTGYNAELTAAVGHNIEIVNQHRDEYGGLQDSPLQGPFTQQWVGGNQHRHVSLNDGTDDSSNRPEAFLISGSTDKVRVYGPAHFDEKAPKALFTRDNAAKSPLNIKNVKDTDKNLGNFSHNYQVVQTSGRDINQSLIENNLTASGVLTTKFVKGVEEYSLPDLTNDHNKTVFVERFSSPGDPKESSRGALDRESEQYAPNNSLTTRNISVRQKYNSQLTQHAAQFNSGSTEGVTVHAVNRNPIKNIELSGSTYITASDYDNFWVQHAIPSTDLRYSWIAESVVDTGSVIQYQNPYDSEELVFNSSSFVISGSNKHFAVDNAGINSLIKDKKSVDLTTNTFNVSSSVKLSASFSEIANTPYGFSIWKQVRTGEHPVVRKLRENNVLSLEGIKSKVVNGAQTISKRSDSVRNYIEPPVTSKFKPLKQTLELKGSNEKYEFIFTHNNNLSTFVSEEVLDYLGIKEDSQQTYDLLRKYYSDPNRTTNTQNPVNGLKQYTYSETLYPREVNAYLAETRARTQYILDQAGTGSRDGYDIQLGTQRAFWRDRLEDRKRSNSGFYNSMNYLITQSAFYSTDYAWGWNPQLNLPNPPLMTYELIKNIDYVTENQLNSIKLFDNNLANQAKNLGDARTIINFETSSGDNILAIMIKNNGCNGELNGEIFFDYYYTSSIQPIKSQLTRVTDMSVLLQFDNQITGSYGSLSSIKEMAKKPRVNYLAFLGGFESGSRDYGNSTPSAEIYDYDFYSIQPTGDILSTLDSGLRYASESFSDKKPWFDSYEKYSDDIRSHAKDHSVLPEFRISSNIPFYVTQNGGNFRTKNSSYLELDGVGQNYRSSLTASNIKYNKEFIDSYTTTDVLNNEVIQQENSNLSKLQNIKFTVSGIKKLLPYNGFYPQERTIQLANLFNNYMDNNVGGGFFRINGDGNYTQILVDLTQSSDLFAKNTIMPYYFAPGILYNTIKSGISVNFPSVTASYSQLPIQSEECSVSKQVVVSPLGVTASYLAIPLNSKASFESLIFPESFIPTKTNLTSSFNVYWDNTATDIEEFFNQTISDTLLNIKIDSNSKPDKFFGDIGRYWKSTIPFAFLKNDSVIDPSYSMAMSNFLAEIPRFFLKNGSMNVFKSAEVRDWKTFEIGKKYYFDLKMKKSSDLVMMEAYRSDNHITGANQIEKTFNGRYFGWPVSKVSGTRTADDDYVIHNDPAYAPFTPPYFEGEATLRFELTPTSASYKSVNDLLNDIFLINIFDQLGKAIDTGSEAYRNKMSIQDCMEVFGIGLNPITTFDGPNSPNSYQQLPDPLKEYWAISPKLETPVLDFSDQEFVDHTGSYWVSSGYGRGMWSGYGKIPTGSKGITIEIAESFPLQTGLRTNLGIQNLKTGSLLRQVGFTSEKAKIGQLAEKKTISEAIVMIPYVDKPIPGVTTFVDNHHFFAINKEIYNTLKDAAHKGIPAQIPNEMIGYESSVTKMIKGMGEYVIPPAFNFLKYENIDPFVMYMFEFKHDLDQQDLADIWQGVMPKIAMNAEHDVLEFEHKVGQFELFGENFTPPGNMRWLVFKVKKKAEWNYFAITENIGDDQNFKFKFSNSQEAKTPDYSYNWPYDYFSLVELAKVDVSLTYDEKPQFSGSLQTDINLNQFAVGNIPDFTDLNITGRRPRRRRSGRHQKAGSMLGKKK